MLILSYLLAAFVKLKAEHLYSVRLELFLPPQRTDLEKQVVAEGRDVFGDLSSVELIAFFIRNVSTHGRRCPVLRPHSRSQCTVRI